MSRLAGMVTTAVALGVAGCVWAAEQAVDLRVTRVALFSSGVGYFQREATVSGSAGAELKVRVEQINDILKSLVVQDLDGGSVGVVTYASKDPLERTLGSFAVNLTGDPSLAELLDQLRGQPVEIAGPRALKGTIVGVEEQQVLLDKDKEPITAAYVNILTDAGLQQMRLNELHGIKLADEKIAAELRKALATLATARDADKKTVAIRFDGQGQRRVRASFLLESPIWKTSYRLVLDADGKPFLQGWAMVENATEEDWDHVRLSLVSGRPISFMMDLYTPIYIPRPVEDLELYASLRAPEFEAGLFGTSGIGGGGFGGAPPAAAEPQRSLREEKPAARPADRPAAPARAGRGLVAAPDADRDQRDGSVLGRSGVESIAAAQQAGELFEYAIETPVSIARQTSAMLPIINQEIAGEKVSIYNPAAHPRHPLNGLIAENTTSLNLMQGPVTLFEGNTYAGDAKLPDLKPGEKRMVAYALDLGVEVTVERTPHPAQLVSLRIAKGTLWHRHKNVDERVYSIKNKDDKDRAMILEQAYSTGWTLVEPKEPWERTQNILRLRLPVPAGKTVTQIVRLEHVADQAVALSQVGFDALQMYVRTPNMSPALKDALEKVVALRTEQDQAARQRAEREKEVNEAVAEQGRVRENLKVVQQGTDPYTRQLEKFDTLETQIERLRAAVAELRQEEEQKRQALERYLLSLEIE